MLGQARDRAGLPGLCQKVVGIEAFTAQGHEQVTRLDAAAVRVDAADLQGQLADLACTLEQGQQLVQAAHAITSDGAGQRASASPTCTRSENGRRTPWIS